MNLGQLAQTKGLSALKLIRQIEREFAAARDLDEKLDHAGPDRNLGLLYRDAPSIGSIGSRTKARQHLQRAVVLAPDYPANALNLIEAYLKWVIRIPPRANWRHSSPACPRPGKKLSGPGWTSSWRDWDSRLATFRKKLREAGKNLQSRGIRSQ